MITINMTCNVLLIQASDQNPNIYVLYNRGDLEYMSFIAGHTLHKKSYNIFRRLRNCSATS